MAEMSRVKKFKEYRNSLQNSSEDILETPVDITKDIDDERLKQTRPNTESLSTLSVSYDEIMEAANKVDEENEIKEIESKKINRMRILKISGIVLASLILLGIIITIGVLLF